MTKSHRNLIIFVTFILTFSTFAYPVLSPSAFASPSSSSDNWPMFHHDLTHSGYSTSTTTATFSTLLWNYTTNNVVSASPTIVDDRVYIGSDGGIAYCLNAVDGS